MTRTPNNPRSGQPGAATPRMAEVRPNHGALVIVVEGRPVLPVAVDVLPGTPPTVITDCAAVGVPLLRVRGLDLCWTGNGRFEYTALDARLSAIFAAAKDLPTILEVSVDAPDWWCEAHRDECVVYAAQGAGAVLPPHTASWASARWRGEAGDALGRLVRHIRQSPWGRRCIGFQIAAGEAGEWRQYDPQRLPDVGPRMTERFRAYAVEKYRRNEGLLKKGWDDPRAAYDRIRCPGAEERAAADYGVFRSPVRSRRLLDYFEIYFGAQNDAALHFAGVVKKVSEGQALVGLAYATVFENGGGTAESGHGFPEPVLEAPEIDFIANPGPRAGVYLRALNGSLALRGKLLFHVGRSGVPLLDAALAQTHLASVILPAETDRDMLDSIVKLAAQRHRSGALRKRAAQVAMMVDPACATYLQQANRAEWLNETLITAQARELAGMGAPYDVYMPADLFHPEFPNHKVYVCSGLFYLSEAERRRLDARVKRSEQFVVWGWAAGIAGETGIDAANAQKTSGIKLRVEMNDTELRARIVETKDPVTWGFHVGAVFGTARAATPTITVTDRAAVRLGANSDNKTVFAACRNDTWTGIYCGAAPIVARVLTNVLRAAGCHVYINTAGADDVVLADAGLVAIHNTGGKEITLSLPGVTEVRNAINGEPLGTASDFQLKLGANTTGVYLLRPLPRKKHGEPDTPSAT